jgi:N-methylhydantoinase B
MTRINASTLEIIWKRLIAAVDEASAATIRTAFSTSVRESLDFACALTNAKGELLAQGTQSIPAFVGSLPRSVQLLIAKPEFSALRPGDVIITNDPWLGTGHLPDMTIVSPIHYRGNVIGYAASTAHEVDVGGRAGSLEMTDLFEEGLQVPCLKLIDGGVVNETIIAFLRQNVRAPDELIGDLWSQVSALDIIRRRTLNMMEEYELDDLDEISTEIFDRSESAFRSQLRKVAPGTYRASLKPDALPAEIELKMAITLTDKECVIDLTGSSAQVKGYSINCAFPFTYAYSAFGVKALFAPDIPNNQGVLRCIRLVAPEGSVVNHTFPLAGFHRHMIGHHMPAAVMAALSQVIPERTIAKSGCGPMWTLQQNGIRKGRPYANLFFFNGGVGACSKHDGPNVLSWPTNISGVPVEYMEHLSPLMIKSKGLRPDSGGAGKYRGGLGQKLVFEAVGEEPITVTLVAVHVAAGADGIAGGKAGEPGRISINDEPIRSGKAYPMKPGDILEVLTPGGGGYGDLRERPEELKIADREAGYTLA